MWHKNEQQEETSIDDRKSSWEYSHHTQKAFVNYVFMHNFEVILNNSEIETNVRFFVMTYYIISYHFIEFQ